MNICFFSNLIKDREIIEELQDVWNGFEIRSSNELANPVVVGNGIKNREGF